MYEPSSRIKAFASELSQLTRSEKKAEQHFRKLGMQVISQVPIHQYILDFVDLQKFCIYEIDGKEHRVKGARKDKDVLRDEFFRSRGVRVVRIPNGAAKRGLTPFREKLLQKQASELGPLDYELREAMAVQIRECGEHPGVWAPVLRAPKRERQQATTLNPFSRSLAALLAQPY